MDIEKRNESVLTYNMYITVTRIGSSSERIQLKLRLTGETCSIGDVMLQSCDWAHVYNEFCVPIFMKSQDAAPVKK